MDVLVPGMTLATVSPEHFDVLVHPDTLRATSVVPVHPKRVLSFMRRISLSPQVFEFPSALQRLYDACGVQMDPEL